MEIRSLDLGAYADFDAHERVVECRDGASGLHALIAIHNTNLGPALGGCRMWPYADREEAVRDVLRLSRGMTYKSALARLALGGGKAVIIGNPHQDKSREMFLAMGKFIDALGGEYITAEDSGTSVPDMQVIRERTAHAAGISAVSEHGGDPSPTTAFGTFIGLRKAVDFHLGRRDLAGVRVAVQGVGNVGYHLARQLVEAGAEVHVADIHAGNVDRAVDDLGVTAVPVDQVHALDVDVFSPCAMGGAINDQTLPGLRAKVVAGAANNQLASAGHGDELHRRGILYVPDYAVNAGGIIDIYYQHCGGNYDDVRQHVESTADTLLEVFRRAREENRSTCRVADELAEERFSRPNSSPAPSLSEAG
ncbi:Glu/Leu/Phe/Val dehydrogenase dimerization domain-containing protein [Parahaliea mediterranea]|uniref:Glu/Leu/Phe/Val dehydrogenase n=1 Tax=Parahaliea mediterranea TaxID=651086 RepID=A0A939DI54_9GAMM|nr:Glu/Leu/Phe/Val dehydrogenase dimerization domain-containing protein [Parahaliea mediterranea]MBN7798591.1 Glu/Leu/Phe/Val dehydrogenase [Parahaliea mediterranea]